MTPRPDRRLGRVFLFLFLFLVCPACLSGNNCVPRPLSPSLLNHQMERNKSAVLSQASGVTGLIATHFFGPKNQKRLHIFPLQTEANEVPKE
ncbi:hypothetical protein B0T22DRAFT_453660 [Podospora appendiculata]|uniref:Secreted protein n=1 Tax=Podospora appendiculata TaxID=314037 RepID=A0AAE1CHM9_9PEZI|nr:hypothetical protein B0T22DRAFT_453660 [Podospora appendiculata]